MAKAPPCAITVTGLLVAMAPAAASAGTLSLQLENDILGGSDRYYTNGLQLAWRSAAAGLPGPVAWLDRRLDRLLGPGATRWGLALGHSIFTPADTSRRDPDPRDRPYAGYLYGSLALSRSTSQSLSVFELQLGLVGPSALGKEVQNNFHRLLNTETYDGWDQQLRDEPVLAAIGTRSWRVPLGGIAGGLDAELLPAATLSLGTAQTYLGGGAALRIGQGLEADFGPPRIRPALGGSGFFEPAREDGFGWYAFAGAEGRAVARDIFLDGNTWQGSRSVDKRPLVADLQAGLALRWGRFRLAYTHVWRSEEFYGQRGGAQQFSSLSLSMRF
jgi:lipid A 3-O-deacylase